MLAILIKLWSRLKHTVTSLFKNFEMWLSVDLKLQHDQVLILEFESETELLAW